jgi:hypothetical protein
MNSSKLGVALLVAVLALAGGMFHAGTGSAAGALATQSLDTLTATDLANALAGSGVTVSNATHTGANVAAGTFTGGTGIIGFESGVILSTGDVANVIGPNVDTGIDTENELPGDADLDTLAGFPTEDASVLEFDFVPTGNTVSFRYVFASDEYNDFVNSEFNDVFAFIVNGTNCALVPGTSEPVTINTINDGGPTLGEAPISHPELFINNDFQDGTAPLNTEMDGLTVVLTCTASVTANATNHVKLAIADGSDDELDSNVFLAANSFVVPPPTATPCATATSLGGTATSTATSTPTPAPTLTLSIESVAAQVAACGSPVIVHTATPTASPTAAATATPIVTVPTVIPGTPAVAIDEPPAPTSASGNIAGVIQGPNTGSGGTAPAAAGSDWVAWLALLVGGVAMAATSIGFRRTRS